MMKNKKFYAYNRENSQSAGKPDPTSSVKITFGSGQLSGLFTTDTCTLGDPNNPKNQMILPNFNFGLVQHQLNIFKGSFDAIVGLAYKSMAQPGILPFFPGMLRCTGPAHGEIDLQNIL